jgi:hypothetical protein
MLLEFRGGLLDGFAFVVGFDFAKPCLLGSHLIDVPLKLVQLAASAVQLTSGHAGHPSSGRPALMGGFESKG